MLRFLTPSPTSSTRPPCGGRLAPLPGHELAGPVFMLVERLAEPARCEPSHPPKIRSQMALARKPGSMRNLANRAILIAEEL